MKKYLKYLWYVVKHKFYVSMECFKRGYLWRGLLHDLSKFYPDEFIAYARYFNGTYPSQAELTPGEKSVYDILTKEQVERNFDAAWLRHQHRNPHHWQYWMLKEDSGAMKTIPIPRQYLVEMLCDWIGAGKAITGKNNLRDWFDSNKHKIIMNADSWTELVEMVDKVAPPKMSEAEVVARCSGFWTGTPGNKE